MRPPGSSQRWVVPLLAVLAVLFSPAFDGGPAGADRRWPPSGVHVVAPSLGEAVAADGVRVAPPETRGVDQGVRSKPVAAALSAAVAVLLLWAARHHHRASLPDSVPTRLRPQAPRPPPRVRAST